MIEDTLKKLHTLSTETLSREEKAVLRAHMVRTIHEKPYFELVPVYQRALHHGLRVMLSTFIFMVFVAGSVSVIADNALPGDPLYAFKVNVNEEIRGALLRTPEKKAAFQTDRIDTRLNEIKTLAETKTLTKAKQVTVQNALDAHLTALSKELGSATPSDALKVTSELEENLKAKKASVALSIETSGSDAEKNEVLEVYNSALQKISDQEVGIIAKEIDTIEADVLATTDPDEEVSADSTTSATATTPAAP